MIKLTKAQDGLRIAINETEIVSIVERKLPNTNTLITLKSWDSDGNNSYRVTQDYDEILAKLTKPDTELRQAARELITDAKDFQKMYLSESNEFCELDRVYGECVMSDCDKLEALLESEK